MKLILASGSPRRKELLEMMGLDFEIITSNVDESFKEGLTIEEQSERLAKIKADAIFKITSGNRIVIGSDTMVIKGDKIFEKPKSREEAIYMISQLQDSYHTVITSLCVLVNRDGKAKKYLTHDKTRVHIKKMSKDEVKKWVDMDKCMDKAGAYALQSEFGVYIDIFEGNYYTVVGLPIHLLHDILKEEKIL